MQTGIIVLIVLNALLLGIATFDFVTDDDEVSHIFSQIDLSFLIVFTVEIGLAIHLSGLAFFYRLLARL